MDLNQLSSDHIQKASQVLKEVPFSYFQEGVLYEGYIDLIFQERSGQSAKASATADDGWVIVDLKTDQITESQLEERSQFYSKQLSIYETALKELNVKVNEKILYFVRMDQTVSAR